MTSTPSHKSGAADAEAPGVPSLRVGLIGYGLAGRVFHAPLISMTPGLALTDVVTTNPHRSDDFKQSYPGAGVHATIEDLLSAAALPDLVVVATSNPSHVPLAEKCVAAGVAVVIDKPIAVTAAEGRRLVGLAREADVLLSVFQNRRWDGDFLTLRQILDQGQLGDAFRFESRFERWSPQRDPDAWREDPAQGGGSLFDLGSHLIDQALVLFGPVHEVYAQLDARRTGSVVDDDAFVALTHVNGVRSHLWASRAAAQLGPRFRLLGALGGYTKYGLDPQEAQLAAGWSDTSPRWGIDDPARDGVLGAGPDLQVVPTLPGAYQRFYLGVAEALTTGAAPPVDPADAVAVLDVIEAARHSDESRTVVTLA